MRPSRATPTSTLSSVSASLLLGSLLTLGLTACGGTTPAPNPAPTTVKISGEVVLPQTALTQGAAQGVVAQSAAGEGTAPADLSAQANWDAPHVPGELLVSSGGLAAQGVSTRLSGFQAESLSDLGLIRVHTPNPEALAGQLAAEGISSQPNYIYSALATPNDPGFPGNVGIGQWHQDYLTQVGAAEGWAQLGSAPAGVLTAVLDTGVDRSHPDLQGRLIGGYDTCSVLAGGNCQGEDTDPSELQFGQVGHGTAMTGLIGAATNNGLGLSGMTWQGQMVPIKVFGDDGQANSSATTISLARGLAIATDSKVRVINMSLGIPGVQSDPKVNEQLTRAAAADIMMIAAAGNTPDQGLYFPANRPEVMAVGAVNPAGQMSCFSARPRAGETLDLLAPGGESGCGRGRAASWILELTPGDYRLGAGTSEATAITSGAASLIRAAYPGLSALQVRQALVQGGKPTDSAQPQLNLPGALAVAQQLSAAPAPTPQPTPTTYNLTVQAYRNGQPVGAAFQASGQLTSLKLPYELNVPQGTYELRAKVDTSKASYSGAATVTATTNTTANIAVQ